MGSSHDQADEHAARGVVATGHGVGDEGFEGFVAVTKEKPECEGNASGVWQVRPNSSPAAFVSSPMAAWAWSRKSRALRAS